jgi:hypothetical protein
MESGLWDKRPDHSQEFGPRNQGFHAREKLLAVGRFLLAANSTWEKLG